MQVAALAALAVPAGQAAHTKQHGIMSHLSSVHIVIHVLTLPAAFVIQTMVFSSMHHKPVGIRMSAVGTRMSAVGITTSAVGTRLSAVGTRMPAVGTRMSAFFVGISEAGTRMPAVGIPCKGSRQTYMSLGHCMHQECLKIQLRNEIKRNLSSRSTRNTCVSQYWQSAKPFLDAICCDA